MSAPRCKPFRYFRQLLAAAFFLAVLLGLLFYFVTLEEHFLSRGTVEPARSTAVVSPVDGRVAAVHVRDGQAVTPGQALLSFDTRKLNARLRTARLRVRELEALRDLQAARLAVVEKNPLPAEFRHVALELKTRRRKLDQSKERRKHYRTLYERSLVPKTEMDRVDLGCFQDQARYEMAVRNSRMVQDGLGDAVVTQARTELALARVRLRGAQEERTALEAEQAQFVLRAEGAGRVADWSPQPGAVVRLGDVLGRVVLDERRVFQARVDERYANRVPPGGN